MGKTAVQNENYYVVQGWMRNILGLRGSALDIYAIIYGFSQVSHQEFTANINYLCEWLGASRPTIINTLKDLVERGYLTKESNEINGVIYNRYTAIVPEFTGGKETLLPQSKNFTPPSQKTLPNNINNNIEDKEKERKGDQAESYEDIINSLVDNPEIKEALVEFIKMRKLIKKPMTNRALKKVIGKLKELAGDDATLATAILDQSIVNSWQDIYHLKEDYSKKPQKYNDGAVMKKWSGETAKDEAGKDIVY